jgi:A/G-specific adenine glycosylase
MQTAAAEAESCSPRSIGRSALPFRRALLAWYDSARRSLPWRDSSDFYRVWISEVMLQQTRVEAVIPYFHRFLERFPDIRTLADASETDVLAAWSGLGYYSRARNLHRAAKQVAARGVPVSYDEVLSLPGAGPYTAAAISSIALGFPHAAVDGNVVRVISRLTNDDAEVSAPRTRARFAAEAQRLLDPNRPGDFNQAMMELGATVCLPGTPLCPECPVRRFCAARAAGRERRLPVKLKKPAATEIPLQLLAILRDSEVFLVRRDDTERRLASFWELPPRELFGDIRGAPAVEFTHRIVNDRFRVVVWKAVWKAVWQATAPSTVTPEGGRWFDLRELTSVPVTTVTRKALAGLLKEKMKRNRHKSVPVAKRNESEV